MNVLSMGRCGMIGTDMTILMGRYNGDHTDVAIISDRRACPDELGRAIGVESKEFVYKTLRLGPQVAIGFAGAVPLSNAILAALLGVKVPAIGDDLITRLVKNEEQFNYCLSDVRNELNRITGPTIRQIDPPPEMGVSAIVAGLFDDDTPIIAELNEGTGWEVQLAFHPLCSAPIEDKDETTRREFEKATNLPGLDYIASLKAAVKFCAERYCSVNRNYVIPPS